ncbi:hypothetical protein CARUB_v10015589mg [Capsella rubella]|uniref:Fibronectin type-III domain-containing protein n=1 Tax=Capsella rubella TaxID=81985 RepID=R0G9I9_9BRAS|nr:hypothetical protein CARUB_v10015589mg [Capsella rubella]
MASFDKGAAGDSTGINKMSADQRKQLVYELSKDSSVALKNVLQDWPCDEIREILCAESENGLKYTGLTKDEIINKLFKTLSKKNTGDPEVEERDSSPKRQSKDSDPLQDVTPSAKTKGNGTIRCKNLACQAKLRRGNTFCRRCSCCVCHKYDDNKDPSLWLTCNSDSSLDDESCGLSCHLNCAFKSENSGMKEDNISNDVDGYYLCVSCGKRNCLLECLKKQLLVAKEERRTDVLCLRLLSAQKLLKGTKKYSVILNNVEKASKYLETELGGPLTGPPSNMSRGIVNKLVCVNKVKVECASALKEIDRQLLSSKMQSSWKMRFENVFANSVTLVIGAEESSSRDTTIHYTVWHRKSSEKDYPRDWTCELFSPDTRYEVFGLTPATDYCFKVVCFSGAKELSVDESTVSTLNLEDEVMSNILLGFKSGITDCNNLSPPPPLDIASCSSFSFEQGVKLIRQLECSGQVTSEFRRKFLTWYSLRATAKEKYVVQTFIETFGEDTKALAEQLIDTFSDCITRKRPAVDSGI